MSDRGFGNLWRDYLLPFTHRGLIRQLALREVAARYKQSWLGTFWLILTPLLMLAVYTLVFREVFQVRWAPPGESALTFALRIFAGLTVFTFFADFINRSPNLVVEQAHLVKKVLFPVQLLCWSSLVAGLVNLAVSGVLMLLMRWWSFGSLPLSAMALPLVWLPLFVMCLGFGWLLSSLGTYIRDIAQFLSMIVSALVFLSPVFFPAEVLPKQLQAWMWLNPLAPIMTQTRMVLLQGDWPNWSQWSINMAFALMLAISGAWLFKRIRPGFSDVL